MYFFLSNVNKFGQWTKELRGRFRQRRRHDYGVCLTFIFTRNQTEIHPLMKYALLLLIWWDTGESLSFLVH